MTRHGNVIEDMLLATIVSLQRPDALPSKNILELAAEVHCHLSMAMEEGCGRTLATRIQCAARLSSWNLFTQRHVIIGSLEPVACVLKFRGQEPAPIVHPQGR